MVYYYLEEDEKRAAVSERIARLYPNRAETRIIMASEAWFAARWREALDDVQRAVSLDPRGTATLNFAVQYEFSLRRYDEVEALRRAIWEVSPPTDEMRWRQAIWRFIATGSTEAGDALLAAYSPDALRTDRRAVAFAAGWEYFKGDAAAFVRLWRESGANWRFSNEDSRFDQLSVAICLCKLGQREQALPLLVKSRDLLDVRLKGQPDNWLYLGDLALTHALLGESAAADRDLAKLRELAQTIKNLTYRVYIRMYEANVLGWMGRKAEAIDLVAANINQPAVSEIGRVPALRRSVSWWPLQGEPRFEALLADPKNNAPLF
jgi:tetratricopeptide (TPR) repeat protein